MTLSRSTSSAIGWRLENSYADLPEVFFSRVNPEPASEPKLVLLNRPLAVSLGLDANALDSEEGGAIFAGNRLPPGSEPFAQAYAGHQFGHFTALGDGRALALGEQIAPSGERFDIQLKGSGRTPYSRQGDGRAALGPMLREYLISEAMHALGIPTTRSLAVAATGDSVYREEVLEGAVLTRIAASHIRVGTFQWAAIQKDANALKALADYTLRRHFPDVDGSEQPYLSLLEAAIERQASLIASWQLVGFVHGVMNTDNMALSGETIDYGPCAFIDRYDPATVFSSIDRRGRYAFGNQPAIAAWNLARFAETLLPLIDSEPQRALEQASAALSRFEDRFHERWIEGMRKKLGLFTEEKDDAALAQDLLEWMRRERADFTNTFRALSAEASQTRAPFDSETFAAWHGRWRHRLTRQPQDSSQSAALMEATNPVVIPRNHKVEEALSAATEKGDFTPLRELLAVLAKPFDSQHGKGSYAEPAPESFGPYRTFCGT